MVLSTNKLSKVVTTKQLSLWKKQKRQIVALTATEYPIAQLLDTAGVDLILVGDSLSMVALGHKHTLSLTLDEILHHAKAVRRGLKRALLVCDLPFMTYQDARQALHSAGRAIKEADAQAVKMEGGYPAIVDTIARVIQVGIPVMGHIGLTPQAVHRLGYGQQGKTEDEAKRIISEAIALEQAGVFAIVLEHIPAPLAARITQQLTIPTIGVGAGSQCDGQILVTHDLLGLSERQPPFAKPYIDLRSIITETVQKFSTDVREHNFPVSED